MSALRFLIILALSCAGALSFTARGALTNCTSAAALLAELARTNYVTFACAGTITLSSPIVIANDTTLDASGREVTISGNNITRLFTVAAGATLRLTNINLIAGKANPGGAIHNRGTVFATDCLFAGNNATGANGTDGPDGRDSNTVAEDGGNGTSGASGLGGAIYSEHSVALTRCTFATNSATGGNGGKGGKGGNAIQGGSNSGDGGNGGAGGVGRGGAIFNQNYVAITDCTFDGNRATGGNGGAHGLGGTGGLPGRHGRGGLGAIGGGAAINNSFFLSVSGSTFANNRATGGNSADTGVVNNSNGESGLNGGEAQGGAICNLNTAYLINSTFSTNRVFGGAGGDGAAGPLSGGRGGHGGAGSGGNFYNNSASISAITNCTVAGGAAIGGTNGVGGTGATPGGNGTIGANRGGNMARIAGQLWLLNTIIARPGTGANGFGTFTDLGYNMSSDASMILNSGLSFISTPPLIGGLIDNGGPTRTFALNTNSPAIDAGDPDFSPETDQRGFPAFGFARDIGAYEYAVAGISGTITAPDGTGLGGVTVSAGSSFNTVTDAGGNFYFERLPAGEYTITPTHDVYTFDPPSQTVDLDGPDVEVSFTGFPTFKLSGHVRDGVDGISNIIVRAGTRQATTDTNGFYEISGLAPGPYTVTPLSQTNGYAFIPELQQIDLQTDITDVDFSAVGLFTISGRIIEAGHALPNVVVRAGNRSAVTGPTGDYTITQVPAGTQIVTPSSPGYAFDPSSRPVAVDGDETSIDFTAFQAFQVSGLVRNLSDGSPAADVTLTLRTNVLQTPPPPGTFTLTTLTDTNGGFGFTNIRTGTYVLRPERAGHAFTPVTNRFSLGPSAFFTYDMYPIFSMAGRVMAGAVGISNAAVYVRTNGGTTELARVQANANGNYIFTNFTAGTYEVIPDVPGYGFTPTNYIVALQANTNGLDFASVASFSITGEITKDGLALSNVTVRCSGATNVTDINGRYALTNLHPGTYTVTPSRAPYSFVPLNALVTVGPSQSGVNFQAVETFTVTGEVKEGNFPLAGVQVGAGGRTNLTNLDGKYTISGVPSGSNVTVTATLPGYAFTPAQQTIVLDSTKTGVDFTARGLSTISGRVVDARTSNGLALVRVTAGANGRYQATTTPTGAYVLSNVGPGTLTLTPARTNPVLRGFVPATQVVTLTPQVSTNNIDFISYQAFRVAGRVFEEGDTNLPLANVALTAIQPPTDQHRGVSFTNTAFTDAQGRYEFPAMHSGPNTLTPSRAGLGFDPRFVELDLTSHIDNLNFSGFQGFSISGTIRDGTAPVPDVEVTAGGTTNNVLPVRTDATGFYTISGLRPDIYTVRPVRPGYRFTPNERQLEVEANVGNINFAAQGTLAVNGRVLAGASALSGITVRLTSTNNPPLNRANVTDAGGNFIFTNLPPGFVSLNAEPAGMFTPGTAIVDPLSYPTTNFFAHGGRLTIARPSNNLLKITLIGLPSRRYVLQTNTPTGWSDYRPLDTTANGTVEYFQTNHPPTLLFRSRPN